MANLRPAAYLLLLLLASGDAAHAKLAGTDAEDGQLFAKFVEDFEKGYTTGSKERAYRYRVFRRNLRFFDAFNAERSEETGITQGVTPFADLTEAEWEARFHGMVPPDQGVVDALSVPFVPDPAFVAPVAVDWRTPTAALPAGAVAPIKNQGNCGACWDFAAIAALEGANAIATGKLTALSEQEVLDCCNTTTGADPCWGCKGGAPVYAYLWIKANGGLDSEADYPYTSGKNDKVGSCDALKQKTVVAKVAAAVSLPRPAPEAVLMQAIAKGPVAISVSVSGGFRGYKAGVLRAPGCADFKIDHGVSLVGYDTSPAAQALANSTGYWILRNSWTAGWGEKGYMRIAMSGPHGPPQQPCCVACQSSYPTVAK